MRHHIHTTIQIDHSHNQDNLDGLEEHSQDNLGGTMVVTMEMAMELVELEPIARVTFNAEAPHWVTTPNVFLACANALTLTAMEKLKLDSETADAI